MTDASDNRERIYFDVGHSSNVGRSIERNLSNIMHDYFGTHEISLHPGPFRLAES